MDQEKTATVELISIPRLTARLSYYAGFQGWFAYLTLACWSDRHYWILALSLVLTIMWSWFLKTALDKWRMP